MSGPTSQKVALGPPPRWLKCPRKGQVVGGRFVPFKTPLCSLYDDQIPEIYRFYVAMVSGNVQNQRMKIGLWVDLTNTDRFYAREDVQTFGAKYVKLNCRGHGECPSPDQTNTFIQICKDFLKEHSDQLIGVHCTHGFNRTGFLIISYLIEEQNWSVEAAVRDFSVCRPPGIYKQDYINELFKRYGDPDDAPMAPALPDWCDDSEPILDDNEAESSREIFAQSGKTKAKCVEGLPQITLVRDTNKVRRLQRICQTYCGWRKNGFPGSQPVSMETANLHLLRDTLYKVSWKADGVRYLMLIYDKDETYLFDRDNTVFSVPNMTFPQRKDDNGHLKETLVDGELIFDVVNEKKIARYLIYDIIALGGIDVGKQDFERRMSIIMYDVINPRQKAKEQGRIDPSVEPFSVRIKDFWPLTTVEKLLSAQFQEQVAHEIDGLIFQPVSEPYVPGRCDHVLKWKPHELNSVDFKLKIVKEQKQGMLPEWKGHLYVLHLDEPFATMRKVTKELRQYDNKIIECTFDSKEGWKFLRERRDKSFPNAFQTAVGVCNSIRDPVTKDKLFEFIKLRALKPAAQPDARKRPAPSTPSESQPNKHPNLGPRKEMPPPPVPR